MGPVSSSKKVYGTNPIDLAHSGDEETYLRQRSSFRAQVADVLLGENHFLCPTALLLYSKTDLFPFAVLLFHNKHHEKMMRQYPVLIHWKNGQKV